MLRLSTLLFSILQILKSATRGEGEKKMQSPAARLRARQYRLLSRSSCAAPERLYHEQNPIQLLGCPLTRSAQIAPGGHNDVQTSTLVAVIDRDVTFDFHFGWRPSVCSLVETANR